MILMDTHVWLWWIQGSPDLHPALRRSIDEEPRPAVSAISPWEVAYKHTRRRREPAYELPQWMQMATDLAGVEVLPITPEVAIEAATLLEPFRRDPADRFIVATARVHDAVLATQDAAIVPYPHVRLLTSD